MIDQGLCADKRKQTMMIANSIANQSGVPILIFDNVVRVSDTVTKGVIWPCSSGHAAAGLGAGKWGHPTD